MAVKNNSNINQNIITNGCLQIMYISGEDLEDASRDFIQAYTEYLDIIMVFDGEVSLKVFNKNILLKPGDLFFCTQSTYSEIQTYDKRFSFARLRFIKDKLLNQSIKNRFAASLLESEILKYKIFNHCLSYIDFFDKTPEKIDEKEGLMLHQENIEIFSILDFMISEEHENLNILENKMTSCKAVVVDAITAFEKDVQSIPKINELVEQLDVSHSYFVRVFKHCVGATPKIFIRTMKINHSLSLISLKLESLSDISYMLGFTDQSHFSNTFRQSLQLTPGDAVHH